MPRKAVFLYNPVAGRGNRRAAIIEAAAHRWAEAGYTTELVPTTGPQSAPAQAREILLAGCDVLIACGGDGTVHEVLQPFVETQTQAALGIIPLGTGNVVARNLRLPSDPLAAAERQLSFAPRRISCGVVRSTLADGSSFSRYFAAAAGVGLHAKMLFDANALRKNRGGMNAYYIAGYRAMFRDPMPPFNVEVTSPDGSTRTLQGYEVLAMKVAHLAGAFIRWCPGGSLLSPSLQILVVQTDRRLNLLYHSLRCIAGGNPPIKNVVNVAATRVYCHPAENAPVLAEADGEVLGLLPAEIGIRQDAFALLMPRA